MMTTKADNIDTECSFSQVEYISVQHLVTRWSVAVFCVPDIFCFWGMIILFSVLRLINTLQSSLSDRILNLQILQFVITHQGNGLFLQCPPIPALYIKVSSKLGSPVRRFQSVGINNKINRKRRALDPIGYDIQWAFQGFGRIRRSSFDNISFMFDCCSRFFFCEGRWWCWSARQFCPWFWGILTHFWPES